MEASQHIIKETGIEELRRIHDLQKSNRITTSTNSATERIKKLKLLHKTLNAYREDIRVAIYKDCKRHPSAVDITELYPVISEIKHAVRELRSWMRHKRVKTPLALIGSSSSVKYEAKGNVAIISPWNFPVNLTLSPLVSAIAAGNVVLIKPSEHSPNTSWVLKRIIDECFDENEVALVEGGVDTAVNLLNLKFDHIFFTGSPEIGKKVMAAAARNLTTVTLELGGKSPTIVDDSSDYDQAARRISWAKFANNGQMCIAPDYILVDEKIKDAFCESIHKYLKQFYGTDASDCESYGRIVNAFHYNIKKDMLNDALDRGARVVIGGVINDEDNFITPTVLDNVSLESRVMQEEIFGPILPVIGYKDLDEAIDLINSKEKALALYMYSKSKKNIRKVLANTSSGGVCINHNSAHYFNTNLPFGGVNNSGIGKAHGFAGFKEFSNERAVYKQHLPNALELLMPPFNDFKQKLIDLTLKYF